MQEFINMIFQITERRGKCSIDYSHPRLNRAPRGADMNQEIEQDRLGQQEFSKLYTSAPITRFLPS